MLMLQTSTDMTSSKMADISLRTNFGQNMAPKVAFPTGRKCESNKTAMKVFR